MSFAKAERIVNILYVRVTNQVLLFYDVGFRTFASCRLSDSLHLNCNRHREDAALMDEFAMISGEKCQSCMHSPLPRTMQAKHHCISSES